METFIQLQILTCRTRGEIDTAVDAAIATSSVVESIHKVYALYDGNVDADSSTTTTFPRPSTHTHLLQHLRTRLVGARYTTRRNSFNRFSYSGRSATELKARGISFKQSHSHCLTDISFSESLTRGYIHLPPIIIDDTSNSMFLNLVADEMSSDVPNNTQVASYLCFIDSLIDHPDDVKLLREANIIYNYLGSDEEVANLFNEITTGLLPNYLIYRDVKRKIQAHFDNKKKTWMAQLYHEHFSTPWTVIAFVGAIFILYLGMVQTYLTMFPLNDDEKENEAKALVFGLKHMYMLLAFPLPLFLISLVILLIIGIINLVSFLSDRTMTQRSKFFDEDEGEENWTSV